MKLQAAIAFVSLVLTSVSPTEAASRALRGQGTYEEGIFGGKGYDDSQDFDGDVATNTFGDAGETQDASLNVPSSNEADPMEEIVLSAAKDSNGNGNGNDKKNEDEYFDGDVFIDPIDDGVTEDAALNAPPAKQGDPDDDIYTISDMLGLTHDDTKVLMAQQEEFSKLVAKMEEDTNFLEAEMPDRPDGEFVVRYKNGNVPPQRQDGINKFMTNNQKTKVTTVASKLSLKDAKDRGDRLVNKLEKKEYTNVMFSIDGDAIEVVAKKNQNHNKNDKGKIPPKKAKEILDLDDSDPDADDLTLVLVDYDDEDPAQPLHTYGGRKICKYSSYYRACLSSCTTAFSVKSDSGVYGISTAAHCTGMNLYDATPPESDYSTVFQKQHMGILGDMEWHSTPYHADLAEYYYQPGYRWPVKSVGVGISKGQYICGYSRMQGSRRCDRVYVTAHSVQYSGYPRVYNLVMMERNLMIPGDSGGPWSYYTTAYGVVSGYTTVNYVRRDLWSRVSYFPYVLGVSVLTQ